MTKERLEYFFLHKEELKKLKPNEIRSLLSKASSLVLEENQPEYKSQCYDVMYQCCFREELDIKEIWMIYWMILKALFINNHIKISEKLELLYKYIYKRVRKTVIDDYKWIGNNSSGLIILITSQFLGLGHAPTNRILDYSYTIATELNKNIMIINDALSNFYHCDYLKINYQENFKSELNDYNAILYKNLTIPFYQIKTYMPDVYCINEILRKIYDLKPALVYNIGGESLVADLCGLFTKTACFPCSTNIPITMSKYVLVGRKIEEKDRQRLETLEDYQEVIETLVNYQLQDSDIFYNREMFQLSENDFVLGIIGNRLDIEIDEEFLQVINMILEKINVHFLIIGDLNKEKIQSRVKKQENLHFSEFLEDAYKAINLCQLYCNPNRSGGGRSSFEALANEVPVITLKFGDVYYTCGEDFAVNNYKEYVEMIEKYYNEDTFRKQMQRKAKERADLLSDIGKTQGEILNKIL